jgi:hypothetical protein
MELSTTLRTASCEATQGLSSILWIPKVYYDFHKNLALVPPEVDQSSPYHPILSKIPLTLTTNLSWYSDWFLSFLIPTNNLYTFLYFPIKATWPVHLILLIMLSEEYKLWHSTLHSFSNLPSLCLPMVQLFSSAPCSQGYSHVLTVREQVSHSREIHSTLQFCTFKFLCFQTAAKKNGVFWDVMPCSSYENRRFGGT